jgi:hypothetical protein
MPRYAKVLVICPGNAMTAGPEALHQLVADLNRLGQPAEMVYHPFNRRFEPPAPYRKYGVPVGTYAEEAGTLIVFPEIFTTLALRTKNAAAAVWWMSVNNFTGVRYGRPWRDRLRYWKYVLKGKRPWRGLKALAHLPHFAQSDYAREFLAGHGIAAPMLSDPIPVYTERAYLEALPARLQSAQRSDTILYNPTKGAPITARLMAAYPQWRSGRCADWTASSSRRPSWRPSCTWTSATTPARTACRARPPCTAAASSRRGTAPPPIPWTCRSRSATSWT